MKKLFILVTIALSFNLSAQDFITKWTFSTSTTQINFNAQTTSGAVDYTWTASPSGNSGSGSFTQAVAGAVTLGGLNIAVGDVFTLSMTPTNLKRFYIDRGSNKYYLRDVKQWGNVAWSSMNSAFSGCYNLNISATDVPNLSSVTDMSFMFYGCDILNGPANINEWNTSGITNMYAMFSYAYNFNQNIGSWNTEKVTNMNSMFWVAQLFNQDIGNWETSAVTDMSYMFVGTQNFNQNIGRWDTSEVIYMNHMFSGSKNFNQNIGSWNTSSVITMSDMFQGASTFNQNIGSWNTALVDNMSLMFSGAKSFNQNIGAWNTEKVRYMSYMFSDASLFNQDISLWNTDKVISMYSMFNNATAFNQNIGLWNTTSVTDIMFMFNNATAFNQNIGLWNTRNVNDMSFMFAGATSFNQNIGAWNTSNVKKMRNMFAGASNFNQNIGSWNTALVTDMVSMFNGASLFNQDLSLWNISACIFKSYMFKDATSFNQNLSSWVPNFNSVNFTDFLDNSGLSVDNYDAFLIAIANKTTRRVNWAARNLKYCAGAAARDYLINNNYWTITDDAPFAATAQIVVSGSTISSSTTCDGTAYSNPSVLSNKLININANGNTIAVSNIIIDNSGILTGGSGTFTNSNPAYYQSTDGTNSFRVSKRLHSIVIPGTHTSNGGFIIRLYYNPAENTAITNEAWPGGGSITQNGWFKFPANTAQSVVNSMSPTSLNSVERITPTASGIESGIDYVEFTVTSFSTFGFMSSVGSAAPLPVNLISFSVKNENEANILDWQTASETNNKGFEIEKSGTVQDFQKIGFVVGVSNSKEKTIYTFNDTKPLEGINYYRLKQIDLNGKFEYSNIVSIKNEAEPALKIYPNPANENLTIESKSKEMVNFLVYNIRGQKVKSGKIASSLKLNISDLSKGSYFVESQGKVLKFLKE